MLRSRVLRTEYKYAKLQAELMAPRVDPVLDYWFGISRTQPKANFQLWFGRTPQIDHEIRTLFEPDVERAVEGTLGWGHQEKFACLAQIILLDQFALNIYRGKPASFAASAKAIPLARQMVWNKHDLKIPFIMRPFAYLPLEHSEDLKDQEESVRLFTQLLENAKTDKDEHGTEDLPANINIAEMMLEYAVDHAKVIQQYGRYPGRNAIMGRKSTPAEEEYLHQGGPY